MKPVMQTAFEPGKGDCFAACVASILDMSLEHVPNFCVDGGVKWLDGLQAWLGRFGLFAVDIRVDGGKPIIGMLPENAPCIISGDSPRHDCLHSVVGKFGGEKPQGCFWVYEHDPHPEGGFLKGNPKFVTFLAAWNPAATAMAWHMAYTFSPINGRAAA